MNERRSETPSSSSLSAALFFDFCLFPLYLLVTIAVVGLSIIEGEIERVAW